MNLITGATGMLGTHLMIELLKRGEQVRALKRSTSDITMVQRVFDFYQSPHFSRIEWVEGDVLDIYSLMDAMAGCSRVFHCAAIVSYHPSERQTMYDINIEGTENVINIALQQGGVKVGFVSSIAAIGKAKNNDTVDEESEWVDGDFNTHYAITKQRSEMEFWRGIHEGIDGVAFNCGVIIGPGDFKRSSPSLFQKIGEGMRFYPPGGTGFISAEDCARIIVELTLSTINAERYILVSENLSMKDMFQTTAKALNVRIPSIEATPGMMQLARYAEALREMLGGRKALVTRETVRNAAVRFYYNNEKLRSVYTAPFMPINEAIQRTAAFFKSEQKQSN
ncbi:MAG: NAD-dependent epimerase/dehydratase family protein [Flavobacteriales bacterium]|jgi:dihydroflavonol-4-reductase